MDLVREREFAVREIDDFDNCDLGGVVEDASGGHLREIAVMHEIGPRHTRDAQVGNDKLNEA